VTPEQAALLNKAEDSLTAAKLLADNNLYDFAASRAYYTILLNLNLTFSKHAAVISAFGREFANKGVVPVEYHRYLIAAQNMRNQGDYSIDSNITEAQAREQITRAEEFIKLGRKLI
jgi:uncharacterized protein (UPF0332 family)